MHRKQVRLIVVAILIAALPTSVLATGRQEGAEGGVIRIGASVPLSGEFARLGKMVHNGYELWAQEINARGGIQVGNRRLPVQMVYYDDQSDAGTSARLTEKLITEDGVDFLLGPFGSRATLAAAAIADEYDMITMVPLANAGGIYDRGFRNVFSVLAPADQIFASFIDMLDSVTPRPGRLAIITPNAPFSTTVAAGARDYAESRDFEVVFLEEYAEGGRDLSSTILKAIESGAQALMGSGNLQESILTVRHLEEKDADFMALGFVAGPELLEFRSNLGAAAERVYGVAWWMPEMSYSGPLFGSSVDYAVLYTEKFGEGPTYHAAAASQSALLLQLAIEEAGTTHTGPVREALRAYSGTTFWGPTRWDEGGQNVGGATVTFQIQNDEVVTVWPPEAAWADPDYPAR